MRVGGFAANATAATTVPEAALRRHPAAYLADPEARWAAFAHPP